VTRGLEPGVRALHYSRAPNGAKVQGVGVNFIFAQRVVIAGAVEMDYVSRSHQIRSRLAQRSLADHRKFDMSVSPPLGDPVEDLSLGASRRRTYANPLTRLVFFIIDTSFRLAHVLYST